MSGRCAALCLVLLLLTAPLAAAPPSLADALARAKDRLEQGDRPGARAELTAALRAFPGAPALHNFLGVVEAQDGNYGAAEARFREAIRRAPRLTDAHLNLGRLHQENAGGNPQAVGQALAAYQAVLAYDPTHPEALYQSAILLQATGEFARSLEHLSRLPEGQGQSAQVLAVRCAGLAGVGDQDGADRAADVLLVRNDLSEGDVTAILPTLAARGRSDLGLRLLEGLRSRGLVSPGSFRSHAVALLLNLARMAHQARDPRGALGYLAHARDIDPADAHVHFFFGMVCVDLDLGTEAHTSLLEAVRLEPANAPFNYALGAVSLHRRDASEALPYFRRYAELRPDDPRGPLAVGLAAFRSGDFDSARRELARAAQSPSTATAAHYFLARIAREENQVEPALGLVEKALAADPSYADAWAERGLLHLRKRNLGAAEQDLGRALELDPDNYLANLHLLALYQRKRDPRQAAQSVRMKDLEARREQKSEEFRRVIEVRPYE